MTNNNLGQYHVPEEKIKALEGDLNSGKTRLRDLKFVQRGMKLGQFTFYGMSAFGIGLSGLLTYELLNNPPSDQDAYLACIAAVGLGTVGSLVSAGFGYFFVGKEVKKIENKISELEKKLEAEL